MSDVNLYLDTAKLGDPARGLFIKKLYGEPMPTWQKHFKYSRQITVKDIPASWTVLAVNNDARGKGFAINMACVRTDKDHLVFINSSADGGVVFEVATATEEEAQAFFDLAIELLPLARPKPKQIVMTFSTSDDDFTRVLSGTYWKDIKDNYSADVQKELSGWMAAKKPPSQLILAHGIPGTGKTWAIRGLACEWAKWANFIYVADVNAFFGGKSDYMMRLMFDAAEQNEQGKWNILVFEDMGNILTTSAIENIGDQGLARLLNCVDGFIGQELNLAIIVTSNEKIENVHPAIKRPGRGTVLEFGPLDVPTAVKWAEKNGYTLPITRPMTLAELYHNKPSQTGDKKLGFK